MASSPNSMACTPLIIEENSPDLYVDDDDMHDITDEELEVYCRIIEESEGFDAPSLPYSFACGSITPLPVKKYEATLREAAEHAIKYYNKENDANLEVVEIVKATGQAVSGLMYYITFEVKEVGTTPDHPTTTFQAKVLYGIPNIEIDLCRPKPSNSPSNSTLGSCRACQ